MGFQSTGKMVERVVRMVFREESVDEFLKLFGEVSSSIRATPGCEQLALWRDRSDPRVLFTYSRWSHPEYLEAYRGSELFLSTWARTKALFADRPTAWSLDQIALLP